MPGKLKKDSRASSSVDDSDANNTRTTKGGYSSSGTTNSSTNVCGTRVDSPSSRGITNSSNRSCGSDIIKIWSNGRGGNDSASFQGKDADKIQTENVPCSDDDVLEVWELGRGSTGKRMHGNINEKVKYL